MPILELIIEQFRFGKDVGKSSTSSFHTKQNLEQITQNLVQLSSEYLLKKSIYSHSRQAF